MSVAADAEIKTQESILGKWIHIAYPSPEAYSCIKETIGMDLSTDNLKRHGVDLEELVHTGCIPCIELIRTVTSIDRRLRPSYIFLIIPETGQYTGTSIDNYIYLYSTISDAPVQTVTIHFDPEEYEHLWNVGAEIYKAIRYIRELYESAPLAINLESFPSHIKPLAMASSILAGVSAVYYNVNYVPFIQPVPPVKIDSEKIEMIVKKLIDETELETALESRLLLTDEEGNIYPNPIINVLSESREEY